MDTLLKFQENGKMYYVLSDGDELRYCYMQDGELCDDLTEDENRLIYYKIRVTIYEQVKGVSDYRSSENIILRVFYITLI